uniref:RNA-directed DNA polymerase n=1 Tax=Trichuris muris TaxID=70415 RepID=A0A5S6QLM8_TRIMR
MGEGRVHGRRKHRFAAVVQVRRKNGCIIRGTGRLVIPEALQASIIALAHESHQGIVRTKARLRRLFWWPKLDTAVETYVRNCYVCRTLDKTAVQYRAPLNPVPLQNAAWEKLAIDIVGPLQNSRYGERFAITLVDYYSREIVALVTAKRGLRWALIDWHGLISTSAATGLMPV